MSQHVSGSLQVKLLNSTVLPVLLYGLSSLTLKPMHHSMLRGARTKMLRNMAGWRRVEGESWSVIMHRMRFARSVTPICNVRQTNQNSCCEKRAPPLVQLPTAHQRARGRPPRHWLDDLSKLCETLGETYLKCALRQCGPLHESTTLRYG